MNNSLQAIIREWSRFLNLVAYIIFSLILIAGLGQVISGIGILAMELSSMWSHTTVEPKAITALLHGLEWMFLAPLPAAIVFSVQRWLASVFWPSSMENSEDPGAPEKAEHMVTEMKLKVVTLMAAIAATETVNRAVSESGPAWQPTICGLLIVLVLCGFGLLLKRKLL